MAEKHIVYLWKGYRSSYEYYKSKNLLSEWTEYFVKEDDGSVTPYIGDKKIGEVNSQVFPVDSVVETAPVTANTYTRLLVGKDGEGYKIVEYLPKVTIDGLVVVKEEMDFDEKYGVRVKDRNLKNYIYENGTLITYDDVDCGDF